MRAKLVVLSIMLVFILTSCGVARTISCECNCNCCNVDDTTSKIQEESEIAEKVEDTNVEENDTSKKDIEEKSKSNQAIETIKERNEISEEELKEKIIREEVYETAKNLYLSGEWDGLPTTLNGHYFNFTARWGDLFIDGHHVIDENLDLPDDIVYKDLDSNVEYIPGQGFYAIKDNKLLKYQRKECVTLGKITCEGNNIELDKQINEYDLDDSDLSYYMINDYYPYLYYDLLSDTLILVTFDSLSDEQPIYNLYTFTNHTTSKVESIGKITRYYVTYIGERDHFYYTDLEGVEWEYTVNGPVKYEGL